LPNVSDADTALGCPIRDLLPASLPRESVYYLLPGYVFSTHRIPFSPADFEPTASGVCPFVQYVLAIDFARPARSPAREQVQSTLSHPNVLAVTL